MASPLPAVAVTPVGTPGSAALTAKLRCTEGAAAYSAVPAWLAVMAQLPTLAKLSWPAGLMAHTAGVSDVKATTWPEAPPVAVRVGVVPKACVPGWAKVMACVPC